MYRASQTHADFLFGIYELPDLGAKLYLNSAYGTLPDRQTIQRDNAPLTGPVGPSRRHSARPRR